jgi:hypothetical protein
MSPTDVREIALALPDAIEQDHHGRPSFRVRGKIFATLWAPDQLNVMLDEGGILAASQAHPSACTPFLWGRRPRAVQVDLASADREVVADLLEEAWARKAPRTLVDRARQGAS